VSGRLYGIGVGPGDPELMTLKAVRILSEVPVVAYLAPGTTDSSRHSRAEHSDDPRTQDSKSAASLGPRLSLSSAEDDAAVRNANGGRATAQSSARAIAADYIPPDRTEIAIRVEMRPGPEPAAIYDGAAEEIASHLSDGRDVAVLCEGDPFFYGSFAYLHDRLATRFPTTIVPGVSSLTACASASGRALARRDETLTVLPATLPDAELARRLEAAEAAAILKVGRHLPRLKALLASLGLADTATYVAHATRDDEAVVPLATLATNEAPYFSMILVTSRARP